MGGQPMVFSILFFGATVFYLFFAIYTIRANPNAPLNRTFLGMNLSLVIWSFGFSLANSAPTLANCLFWRRFSALGWGTFYAFLLHFFLKLTNFYSAWRRWFGFLYLPAILSVYLFSLSDRITGQQYNFVWGAYGWINVSARNAFDKFFYVYYISYVAASLFLLMIWRKNEATKGRAVIFIAALIVPFVFGSLTDVVLSSYLQGPLPQMTPLFALIPVVFIYFFLTRDIVAGRGARLEDLILGPIGRAKLYYYVAFVFLANSSLSFLSYFLAPLVANTAKVTALLHTSGIFFLFGVLILASQLVKNESLRNRWVRLLMLICIPIITIYFGAHTGVIAGTFPLILMILSLVFDSPAQLTLVAVVAIMSQLLVVYQVPAEKAVLDPFDYILRMGAYLIAYAIGVVVNRTYVNKMKENALQASFQRMLAKLSLSFVNMRLKNVASELAVLFRELRDFFKADYVTFFSVDYKNGRMRFTKEWHGSDHATQLKYGKSFALGAIPWWAQHLQKLHSFYINDCDRLPTKALRELQALAMNNINSLALVFILEEDGVARFVALGSSARNKWTSFVQEQLDVIASILASGIRRISAEQGLEHVAYFDTLTDLPNRASFVQQLRGAVQKATREGSMGGIMFLDLDNFNLINDALGYSGGDEILKAVSDRLQTSMYDDNKVFYFNANQFAIIFFIADELRTLEAYIRKVMAAFRDPFLFQEQEIFLTASAGAAIFPNDGPEIDVLIRNADTALHEAKAKGQDRYLFCTQAMKETVQTKMQLANDLHRAQERGEFKLVYQPQINLKTGEISGFEALLRWQHPLYGLVPPNEFIPLAESSSAIYSISQWVLETAIKEALTWQEFGWRQLRVAVNLSIGEVNNPRLVPMLDNMLKRLGLAAGLLELEITERVAMREMESSVEVLKKLKQLGVSIAIDDFGMGYSSLYRLKMLPVDRIKIDMQFVHGIKKDPKDEAIISTMIDVAKNLQLDVLAEGVETEEQRAFLLNLDCDGAQGYLFARPQPARVIADYLQRQAQEL